MPVWSDIERDERYQRMPLEKKRIVRASFFDDFVLPAAKQELGDTADETKLRSAWMQRFSVRNDQQPEVQQTPVEDRLSGIKATTMGATAGVLDQANRRITGLPVIDQPLSLATDLTAAAGSGLRKLGQEFAPGAGLLSSPLNAPVSLANAISPGLPSKVATAAGDFLTRKADEQLAAETQNSELVGAMSAEARAQQQDALSRQSDWERWQQELDQKAMQKGFVTTVERLVDSPTRALAMLSDSAPYAVAGGIAGRLVGATSAVPALATETAMAAQASGDQAEQKVRQDFASMDRLVLVDQYPEYPDLARKHGHNGAMEILAKRAGAAARGTGMAVGAATSAATSKLAMAEAALSGVQSVGPTSSRAANTVISAGKEFAQEGIQGGGEEFASNVGAASVSPQQELSQGVAGGALMEGITGAPMGAMAGAMEAPKPKTAAEKGMADAEALLKEATGDLPTAGTPPPVPASVPPVQDDADLDARLGTLLSEQAARNQQAQPAGTAPEFGDNTEAGAMPPVDVARQQVSREQRRQEVRQRAIDSGAIPASEPTQVVAPSIRERIEQARSANMPPIPDETIPPPIPDQGEQTSLKAKLDAARAQIAALPDAPNSEVRISNSEVRNNPVVSPANLAGKLAQARANPEGMPPIPDQPALSRQQAPDSSGIEVDDLEMTPEQEAAVRATVGLDTERVTDDQWKAAGKEYQRYASQDAFNKYAISKSKDPAQIAADIWTSMPRQMQSAFGDGSLQVSDFHEPGLEARSDGILGTSDIVMPDGRPAWLHLYPGGRIALDASKLHEGRSRGSLIYHVASNIAHNIGGKFIGDPAGITAEAIRRRTEHMLNSASRFGTTRHIEPHPHQVNPEMTGSLGAGQNIAPVRWTTGDDAANVGALLKASVLNNEREAKATRETWYNERSRRMETIDNEPVSERHFDEISSDPASGARSARAGSGTLKRTALARSIVSRVLQEQEPGVLGSDAGIGRSGGLNYEVSGTELEGIGYKRRDQSESSGKPQPTDKERTRPDVTGRRQTEAVVEQRSAGGPERIPAPSGIKSNSQANQTDLSRNLASSLGRATGTEPKLSEVRSLSDAFARFADELGRIFGVQVAVIRNDSKDLIDFSGASLRDGVLYVSEDADAPAVTVAMHELLHQMRQDRPDLYDELRAEVERQGKVDEYTQRLRKDAEATGTVTPNLNAMAVEELTADAMGDAMSDPEFLARLAKEKPSKFKRLALYILDALDDLLSKLGKVRDLGSSRYLSDVNAFRDRLADVLQRYEGGARESAIGTPEPALSRKTPQQATTENTQKRQTVATETGAGPSITFTYNDRFEGGIKGALNNLRERAQDKLAAALFVQQDIAAVRGAVDDMVNVYRRENLMHGRTGDRLEQLKRNHVDPLTQDMIKRGVNEALMDDYLEAVYAPERNKSIAAKNPAMPDGGSGMTNQEAADFLAGKTEGHRSGVKVDAAMIASLESLAKRVKSIRVETLNRMVSAGLITKEAMGAMLNESPNYVPLRGKDGEEITAGRGTGRGIDVRGKDIKEAFGRGAGNRASNLLAELIGDAERSIIQSEKNRAGKTLAALVLENPNKDLWEVEPVQIERKTDLVGQVYDAIKPNSTDQDAIRIMIKGDPYFIKVKDKRLNEALKSIGVENTHAIFQWMGGMNRYFSAVLTRYNPSFIAVNMVRDLSFGMTGLIAEKGAKVALNAAKYYAPAIHAMWKDARGGSLSKIGRYAREFSEAGGKTYFIPRNSVEQIAGKIQADVRSYSDLIGSGKVGLALNKFVSNSTIGKVIGDANDAVENAMRLSAYSALRDNGESVEAAAEYAKNITVNFDRKGSWSTPLNAIILFYNAATQGAHRSIRLLKNRKVQAAMGALATTSFALAALAMGVGEKDEDGLTEYEKIPQWEKERNFIIPIFGTDKDGGRALRFVKIPMPYGFNVFGYFGTRLAELTMGANQKPSEFITDMGSALVNAFSPLKFTEGMGGMQPHFMKIFSMLEANRDDLGIPIRASSDFDSYDKPKAYTGKASTPEAYKDIAKGLNLLGGGDEVTPPMFRRLLDWAPEDLEFLTEQFTGGIGTFASKTYGVGEKLVLGLDTKPTDYPILRSFIGEVDPVRAASIQYYKNKDELEREKARVKIAYRDGGAQAANKVLSETPELAGYKLHRFQSGKHENKAGAIQLDAKRGSVASAYKLAEKELRDIGDKLEAAKTRPTSGFAELKAKRLEVEELLKKRAEAQGRFNAAKAAEQKRAQSS